MDNISSHSFSSLNSSNVSFGGSSASSSSARSLKLTNLAHFGQDQGSRMSRNSHGYSPQTIKSHYSNGFHNNNIQYQNQNTIGFDSQQYSNNVLNMAFVADQNSFMSQYSSLYSHHSHSAKFSNGNNNHNNQQNILFNNNNNSYCSDSQDSLSFHSFKSFDSSKSVIDLGLLRNNNKGKNKKQQLGFYQIQEYKQLFGMNNNTDNCNINKAFTKKY